MNKRHKTEIIKGRDASISQPSILHLWLRVCDLRAANTKRMRSCRPQADRASFQHNKKKTTTKIKFEAKRIIKNKKIIIHKEYKKINKKKRVVDRPGKLAASASTSLLQQTMSDPLFTILCHLVLIFFVLFIFNMIAFT